MNFLNSTYQLDSETEILSYDLHNVQQSLDYLRQQLMYIVKREEFKDNGASIVLRRTRGFFRTLKNTLEKKRICTVSTDTELPCKILHLSIMRLGVLFEYK